VSSVCHFLMFFRIVFLLFGIFCGSTAVIFIKASTEHGIDRKAASQETEACLNLGAIYTALLTLSVERESPPGRGQGWVEQQRLSAIAQLNQHPRLVLLGDPGSGKSTFVNFVVMCLAGEWLTHPRPLLFC